MPWNFELHLPSDQGSLVYLATQLNISIIPDGPSAEVHRHQWQFYFLSYSMDPSIYILLLSAVPVRATVHQYNSQLEGQQKRTRGHLSCFGASFAAAGACHRVAPQLSGGTREHRCRRALCLRQSVRGATAITRKKYETYDHTLVQPSMNSDNIHHRSHTSP